MIKVVYSANLTSEPSTRISQYSDEVLKYLLRGGIARG